MAGEFSLGHMAGLRLVAQRSFFAGSILLWVIFGVATRLLLGSTVTGAIALGLGATVFYWIADLVHQLGHAYAAQQTGYPMVGIRFGTRFIFSTSLYPRHERLLPAEVHTRRALGGPVASVVFGTLAGIVALALGPTSGLGRQLALFLFATSFIWFGLGAFLPLGFTDGSTLLEWRGRRQRRE